MLTIKHGGFSSTGLLGAQSGIVAILGMELTTPSPLPREVPFTKRPSPAVSYALRDRAKKSIASWVSLARERLRVTLPMPSVSFDLTGKTAGFAYPTKNHIRLNRLLLKANTAEFESNTIPHELAHLIVHHLHGGSVKAHGPEWRAVMCQLGVSPDREHHYDVTHSRVSALVEGYACGCGKHPLALRQHNRVQRGTTYLCRECSQLIKLTAASPQGNTARASVAPRHVSHKAPTLQARSPSEAMLRFALALAAQHGIPLDPEVQANFDACHSFIAAKSNRAPLASAVPAPPTTRQISYAKGIAAHKHLKLPPEVLLEKDKLSRWISDHQ